MQQQIAGTEGLAFKAGTVAGKEKPMTDLAAQQLDAAEGREFAAEVPICRIDALGKNEPDAIILGRFGMVSEHAHDAVAQVDGQAGEHAAHLGVQRRERLQDECVRGLPL
jgi:hypothetical protein